MRTIISLAHISLDGYIADATGGIRFISYDEALRDYVQPLMAPVDTAIYGRTTYEMMESYWPGEVDAKDDYSRTHARWYRDVAKIVASRTLKESKPNTRIVGDDIVGMLRAEKQKPGGAMMIFASATLTHALAAADVVDEWRLTIQPVMLGGGLSLFSHLDQRKKLELRSSKAFASGVIAAHYATVR
ncbi:MAG TPA: dihydrofolate reductase family protein [Kofleriaceae bacterium]|jgi:dihydrofolate reductase